MSAIAKYNGVNAFTAKPLGIDTREGNGLYTPNVIPQTGLLFLYDPAHPNCYPGSGTTLFDLSSQGNDSTILGGLESSYDSIGFFSADGVNDYCTTSTLLFDSNTFSLGGWFRLDSNTTLNFEHCLSAVSGTTLITLGAQRDSSTGDRRVRFQVRDSVGSTRVLAVGSYGDLLVGEWYFVGATYNNPTGGSAGELVGYFYDSNGLSASNSRSDSAADFATNSFSAGMRSHFAGGAPAPTSMGDRFFFDSRILTQSEFTDIYNNTKARYGY